MKTGCEEAPATFTAARLPACLLQPQPEQVSVALHSEGGDRGLAGWGRLGRASILVGHIGEVLSYRELIHSPGSVRVALEVGVVHDKG